MDKTLEKMSDDQLDGVAGGVIFNAGDIDGSDRDYPWEVLDSRNGRVIRRFRNRRDAADYAWHIGESEREVDWNEVCDMRDRW